MDPVGTCLQRPDGVGGSLLNSTSSYRGEAPTTVSAFSNSTADWQCLDSVWYRKVHVFDMLWAPERQRFEAYFVAAAPYGGPIACVRNEKVFQPARRSIKPELQIFTARGRLVAKAPWIYSRLVCFSWNFEEVLVCVFQDGVVRTFSPQCEKLHFFSLDERIRAEGGVVQARVATCGIVVVTATLKLYVNQAFDRSQLLLLPDAGLRGPPLSLCALPSGKVAAASVDVLSSSFATAAAAGRTTKLEEPRLLVAAENGPLLLVDAHKCVDLSIEGGPFVTLSLSRSGNLLAGLTVQGHLKVLSTGGVPRCIVSPFLERQRKPRQVAWCGDDCIALNIPMHTPSGDTQHVLLLGGPKDEWIPYQYGSSSSNGSNSRGSSGNRGGIYLVSEIDGLRVISGSKTEFLHRLPHSTDAIFSIGSCEPPAMLCYAMEKFKVSDAAADESLRAIARDLGPATEACVDAATYEWKYEQVAFLLQAAVFGRQFLDRQHKRDCQQFVRACRDLRVCYAVRQAPLDMALSVAQLRHLTLSELVRRIANRREHLLAYRICEYVGLPARGVLASWALEKIHHSIYLTDEELSEVICNRLADIPHTALGRPPPSGVLPNVTTAAATNTPALPFAKVALCAAQAGRPVLATRLVEFEPLIKEQVRMLLKLAEVNVATEKAVSSGNADLVMQCISAALAHEQHSQGCDPDLTLLVEILQDRPLAQDIFAAFCRETGQLHLLLRYYERSGNFYSAGWTAVNIARIEADEEKKKWLAHAAGFFASQRSSELASFAHSSALYQISLLSQQRELGVKMKRPQALLTSPYGLGPSLMQTVRELILRREFKEADNLQKMFKIPEHRYWRCKIDALADGQHFDALLAFANSKPSPVGYEPFITACVRNDAVAFAAKFIPKLKDLGQQYLWYSHFGMRAEAEAAAKQAGAQSLGGGLFQTLTDAFKGRR